jgi:hypothetical protein
VTAIVALQVGDRVWVGVPSNETPGHILSIHHTRSGRVEYIVRTIDLAGRPGENLNLRVTESERGRVLRPRAPGDVTDRLLRERVDVDVAR